MIFHIDFDVWIHIDFALSLPRLNESLLFEWQKVESENNMLKIHCHAKRQPTKYFEYKFLKIFTPEENGILLFCNCLNIGACVGINGTW